MMFNHWKWLCGCQLFAKRWIFHTALSKTNQGTFLAIITQFIILFLLSNRLGTIVHQKTAAVLAITAVRGEDQKEFTRLAESFKTTYNEAQRLPWGEGILGTKAQAKLKKREVALEKEKSRKMDT